MKLGIFLPNWVGDACMATPAVRAIRAGLPNAELVAIGQNIPLEIFAGTDWFDHTIAFRQRSKFSLLRQLRKQNLDSIVLLTNSLWTAMAAFLGGVKRRIGYDRDYRGWLLTDAIPVPRAGDRLLPIPAIDYYLKLAERIDCLSLDRHMEIGVEPKDLSAAEILWQQIGFSTDLPTVVINSSGAWGQARLWPASHVTGLAIKLANLGNIQVLLHCGPSERELTNHLAKQCDHPNIRSMGQFDTQLPLGFSKAVLQRASVVVSTDSGPRHIAVALNRPVVSLFGPTAPKWTETYNVPEVMLSEKLNCQPCYKRSCPLQHHQCMQNLSIERVFRCTMQRLYETDNWKATQNSAA